MAGPRTSRRPTPRLPGIEQVRTNSRHRIRRDRLLKEPGPCPPLRNGLGRVVGVPGHEERRHVGLHRTEAFGQDRATHFGHHHIGHEEIDGRWMTPGEPKRLAGTGRAKDTLTSTRYSSTTTMRVFVESTGRIRIQQ